MAVAQDFVLMSILLALVLHAKAGSMVTYLPGVPGAGKTFTLSAVAGLLMLVDNTNTLWLAKGNVPLDAAAEAMVDIFGEDNTSLYIGAPLEEGAAVEGGEPEPVVVEVRQGELLPAPDRPGGAEALGGAASPRVRVRAGEGNLILQEMRRCSLHSSFDERLLPEEGAHIVAVLNVTC